MQFSTVRLPSGELEWGALLAHEIALLGPTALGSGVADSLRAAIAAGVLPTEVPSDATRLPVDAVTFAPVVPDPGKIVCVGVNYADHTTETGRQQPDAPTLFLRVADSQLGHGGEAIFPSVAQWFDYEGELALVIGRLAYQVEAADALSHVAGVAPYNDFSVRDWQRATPQWTAGKNFVATGAFGPAMVTLDEVGPLEDVRLTTRVNGEVRQDAPLTDLVFGIGELLAHITTVMPLRPGDVVVTGTPGGVGMFSDPPRLLADGDVVEVAITGVGTLRNRVVRGRAALPTW
ncbi:fumarylacetoacetate hydrolase family protein [Propioniciclava coleopterorum]|uniref:Fumarylacetoacetate hydrolase family protein n=1 Tax=Propioniciclava coleopterorum TaxID=2714937 RepID=A0A6G7YA95_9ACTN|nr:fumarylacetoacetate hydrolase family protein [Propioniciclava coleopterorum]QIK73690.1 fumarylacetoacetate hydrolase family protein [Propioniciclava coleopterorum]